MIDNDSAARVMVLIRKMFTGSTITLEQEKAMLRQIKKAATDDAAFEAVDMMANEGVRYPMPYDFRTRLERIHQRIGLEAHLEVGPPGVTFREWYAAQDADMQARVRRVFPSLKVQL